MVFDPCQMLICYPSDGKAAETNLTKFEPLVSHIPGLKEELMKPRAKRGDRYKFSNEIVYFQGSGSKIVSKSCKVVCLDEIDQFSPEHPQNVRDGWKRTRSFSACMEFAVCSPTVEKGSIWQEFLMGSQAYYTLRCRGCGRLTMRSCDIHNLQFESDYSEGLRSYTVRKGTERLCCPLCGREHTESEKAWMIQNGDYVHQLPELKRTRPSYQIGALASMLPALSWSEIAAAQLEAGKTADLSVQQNFDNSWRGLPYRPRPITKDEISSLRDRHIWKVAPSIENAEMVFIAADTMDDFVSYAVFAWCTDDSLYMLECGELQHIELDQDKRDAIDRKRKEDGLPPIQTLEDKLLADYLASDGVGVKPTMLIIDQGGHRAGDVRHFAKGHRNVIMQKGTSMTSAAWRLSDSQERLLLCDEKHWRSAAVYYLYSQRKTDADYLWLYPDISDEHIAEIRDVRPDESSKWGNEPRNWVPKTGKDHQFDCIKYAYLAKDFMLQSLSKSRYRFGRAPSILRRHERQQKREDALHQEESKGSWWKV